MKFEPREIIDEGDTFSIRWADDAESRFEAPALRRACACASCVNEWTGEQMLKPESVPDDVKIEAVNLVGRYALNFKFSDKHETGIYSFKYLRELADRQP
jgi:DUF971 family protein